MNILPFFIFILIISRVLLAVQILKFTDNRDDDTGAKIISSKPRNVSDLTLCLDFEVTLIKDFRIISTKNTRDLEIQIPNSLDQIQVEFKGIWYIAYTDQVEPYNWGTFCLSYDSAHQSISLAYKGKIIFSKKDPTFNSLHQCQFYLHHFILLHISNT